MLSIGKVTVGQHGYYEKQVAQGRDDYYSGRGEAPGQWIGSAAGPLGLAGRVEAARFNAMIAGLDPSDPDGVRELRGLSGEKAVAGYDLTFSAPKSVSVLYATADEFVSGQLVEAHEAAMIAALAYVEDEACRVRRGRAGAQVLSGEGFLGAAYRHRMSRAQDPQLHTHVVIANAAKGPDGRWTGLWGTPIYQHAKTAGMLYQAHLRAEVRERLGLEWGPVSNGMADLVGVEEEVREHFSQRRAEMLAAAGENGTPALGSKASSSALAVATRDRKQKPIDTRSWRRDIRARASEHGLGEQAIETLVRTGSRALERGDAISKDGAPATGLADELASAHGLTERANAFDARDVLQAHAQDAGQGRRVDLVREDAAAFAARGDVLGTVGGGMTTAELVACEQRLVAAAVGRARSGVGVVEERSLTSALAGGAAATLTEQQAAAVRAVASSGNGVDVVEALAGTGKTYMAGVLREVYEAEGYRVVGIAPTGRAVRELIEQAGMPAWTIDRAQLDADAHGGAMAERSVVILDEAGMAATRATEKLLARMDGVKVIVIGDSGQLSSVQAGGWMAELRARLGGSVLDQVIRQRDARERGALGALHQGRPEAWLAWAEEHHRVVVAAPEEALKGALAAWQEAVAEHGIGEAVLIARENATRGQLNTAARQLRAARGELGEQRDYGAVSVAVGDRVIARRNDARYDVDNGTRGAIEAVHADSVMLRSDSGLRVELPAGYVAEHLEYAYCLTGHGMQGATVENATVVAAPRDLSAGWAYTALSRARGTTHLVVMAGVASQAEQDRAELAPAEAPTTPTRAEVLASVAARMLVRDDEDLAIAQLTPTAAAGDVDDRELHAARAAIPEPLQEQGAAAHEGGRVPLSHLRAELDALKSQRRLLPVAQIAELTVAEQQAARAGEQLVMLQQRLEQLPAPRARLLGGDRHKAERQALSSAVSGGQQQLTAAQRHVEILRHGIEDPAGVLAQDAALQRRAGEVSRELRGRVTELVDRELAAPSPALVELVGERPEQRAPQLHWERSARPVAAYRAEHEITSRGIGPKPENPQHQRDWQRATRALEPPSRGLEIDR